MGIMEDYPVAQLSTHSWNVIEMPQGIGETRRLPVLSAILVHVDAETEIRSRGSAMS